MIDNVNGNVLSIVALGLNMGNGAVYWPKVKALRVPLRPVGHQAVMVLGIVLAVMAFWRGVGLVGGTAAILALLAGGMFLFFTLTSRVPKKVPSVAVDQPAPNFTTMDADGSHFTLSSLNGTPVLLKFFRGGW